MYFVFTEGIIGLTSFVMQVDNNNINDLKINLTRSHFSDAEAISTALKYSVDIINGILDINSHKFTQKFSQESERTKVLVYFITNIFEKNKLNTENSLGVLVDFLLSNEDPYFIGIGKIIEGYFNDVVSNSEFKSMKKYFWINKVEEAIREDNIVMFFQPIVNREKNIVSYESLVRIKNGDEIIAPGVFLPFIKDTGVMKKLSEHIVSLVCDYMIVNNKFNFSINLTENDLVDNFFIEYLFKKTEELQINNRLILEVLEEVTGKNSLVIEVIKKIRKKGIKIAIDDFGTGHSTLYRFLEIENDILKLDRELVEKLINDSDTVALLETIINLAHKKGIQIVAEYVENKEVFKKLKDIGVDLFQGYYFGKPEPLEKPSKKVIEKLKIEIEKSNKNIKEDILQNEYKLLKAI